MQSGVRVELMQLSPTTGRILRGGSTVLGSEERRFAAARSMLKALNEQGISRYHAKPRFVVCRVWFRIELLYGSGLVWFGFEGLSQ